MYCFEDGFFLVIDACREYIHTDVFVLKSVVFTTCAMNIHTARL